MGGGGGVWAGAAWALESRGHELGVGLSCSPADQLQYCDLGAHTHIETRLRVGAPT